MRHGEFWFTILSTLIRILLGYVFGVFSGVLLAVVCFRLQVIDIILSPILSIIRAVPVASFIILALVWIGRPIVPSFISYLMVLPPWM